tara:strand:- start:165 stop:392 length:228 start_codon:yes stop_codon:yes gene_type:complete
MDNDPGINMNTLSKHQIPSPPAPTPKPQKPTKVPEVAEPKEPKLPSLPKSVDWEKVQAIVEKHVGEYLKKISKFS